MSFRLAWVWVGCMMMGLGCTAGRDTFEVPQDLEEIAFYVAEDSAVTLNGTPCDLADLPARLEQITQVLGEQRSQELKVTVMAHPRAKYAGVQAVMKACTDAGLENVSFGVRKEP